MSNTATHNVLLALAALRAGEILVVTDDDDREGEGDLIVAAALCTPEKMAFIVRHTSGIVCTPLPTSLARHLKLDPMVRDNNAPLSTAFTITVDYKVGLTTGISAIERTATVRALAQADIQADDFVRPGHIFPLIARDGGVLMRAGHTEAAVDLCELADLPPVGVICELVNDDGTVMKGRDVLEFCARHQLKRLTIDDLITYRQAREKLVTRVSDFNVETEIGSMRGYAFSTPFDNVNHFAFVYGDPLASSLPVLTRFHRGDIVSDIFGGGHLVRAALRRFKQEGSGILIYLRDGTAGVPTQAPSAIPKARFSEVLRTPDSPSDPLPLEEQGTKTQTHRTQSWREVGLGAQILRDLNVHQIRLLTSSKRTFAGLSGFQIHISAMEHLDA